MTKPPESEVKSLKRFRKAFGQLHDQRMFLTILSIIGGLVLLGLGAEALVRGF